MDNALSFSAQSAADERGHPSYPTGAVVRLIGRATEVAHVGAAPRPSAP